LYELLLQVQPSPVVELNHAVAVAMADGIEEGLRLLHALEERRALPGYYLLPAAQADLLRRSGRWQEAEEAYERALGLVGNDAERRFLERRLAEVRSRTEGCG
jgi:RNA polymerase sigma-70 factor (ECF subfamily)